MFPYGRPNAPSPHALPLLPLSCRKPVSWNQAAKDPSVHIAISQILQVLVDRSRCLYMCAEFPRGGMSLNYTLPLNPLPTIASPLPTMPSVPSSDCCLVVLVEGMATERKTEYLPKLTAILDQCVAERVDLVIYTDADIPELYPRLEEMGHRGLWIRYIQNLRFQIDGALVSVDDLIRVSTRKRSETEFGAMARNRWDVLHGRIDFVKIVITRDVLSSGMWQFVGYQDVGKVAPIAHFLTDENTRVLTRQFGILQSGGALPENYAWITAANAAESWKHTATALVDFFTNPPNNEAIHHSDMSHFSTLGALLVRQHYVYSKCQNPPSLGSNVEQVLRLGSPEGPGSVAGGILPCTYTFVNSYQDIQVALAVENLSCSNFSNLVTNNFSVTTTQRVVCTLHRLSMLQAQEGISGETPYIQCAESVLRAALELHQHPIRVGIIDSNERMHNKRKRRQNTEEQAAGGVYKSLRARADEEPKPAFKNLAYTNL